MSNTKSENISDQYQTVQYAITPGELLSEAEKNFNAAFVEFDNLLTPDSTLKYFSFVEGYDRDYYYAPVSNILGSTNAFIGCGGKKNVIRMYLKLSRNVNYSSLKTLYFVDKDYDDNSRICNDIFVTDFYSVENYYCSDLFLENVLKSMCHVNCMREAARVNNIMADFHNWLMEFYNATKDFCAWYMDARKRMVPDSPDDYKEHFPSSLVKIHHTGINKLENYTLDSLNTKYKTNPPVTQNEYSLNLSKINGIEDIRGKFVLEFIDTYLKHLDNAPKGSGLGKGWGYHSNRKTFLTTFSSCSYVSDSLREYIKSRK